MAKPSVVRLGALVIGITLMSLPTFSQSANTPAQEKNKNVTTGVVVSSSARTVVVRTQGGQHVLFMFERETARPRVIPGGATVRVVSRADTDGTRVASNVTVTAPPSKPE